MEHFANKFWTHPNAFVTYVLLLHLFFLISEWITCCPQVFVALKGLKVAQTVTKLQLSNASKKRTALRKGGNAYSDSLASGFTIIQLRCTNQSDCTTKEKKHWIPQSIPLLPLTGDGALQPQDGMTQPAGNTPSPGSEMWKSRAEILRLIGVQKKEKNASVSSFSYIRQSHSTWTHLNFTVLVTNHSTTINHCDVLKATIVHADL